jgi:hypothetical protein
VAHSVSDAELVARAQSARDGDKFSRLWAGDTSQYGDDHSRADPALCALLAFWTGCDPERMDRLFRQSGLMREKWDRSDYRERTINNAVATVSQTSGGHSRGAGSELQPLPPNLLGELFNDHGNARRLLALYRRDLQYSYAMRKWLVWDQKRWTVDDRGLAEQLAKRAMLEFLRQAVEDGNETAAKFAARSLNRFRIANLLAMAQSEVPISTDELDVHPRERLLRLRGLVEGKAGERNKVVGLYCKSLLNDAELARQLEEIDKEAAGLASQIEALEEKQGSVDSNAAVLANAGALLTRLRERLDQPLTYERKRQLVELLVGGIRIETIRTSEKRENVVTVMYRFPSVVDTCTDRVHRGNEHESGRGAHRHHRTYAGHAVRPPMQHTARGRRRNFAAAADAGCPVCTASPAFIGQTHCGPGPVSEPYQNHIPLSLLRLLC